MHDGAHPRARAVMNGEKLGEVVLSAVMFVMDESIPVHVIKENKYSINYSFGLDLPFFVEHCKRSEDEARYILFQEHWCHSL